MILYPKKRGKEEGGKEAQFPDVMDGYSKEV